jgi:hypothetical protein
MTQVVDDFYGKKNATFVIILANLLTILGVIFLEWDALAIICLYWFENTITGFFNVLKMAFSKAKFQIADKTKSQDIKSLKITELSHKRMNAIAGGFKYFLIPFFIVHFGGFCVGHAVFLDVFLFGNYMEFGFTGPAISILTEVVTTDLIWGAAAIFVAHLVSFFVNYLGKREFEKIPLQVLMFQPYSRIFVMHVSIILMGALLFQSGNNSAIMVISFIVIKAIVDVRQHIRTHKNPDKLIVF